MKVCSITTAALSMANRLNARHPWSHNDAYTPLVMHHARRVAAAGGTRAVDVGCSSGHLVQGLATIFPAVTGIDVDAASAQRTTAALAHLPHVSVQHAALADLPGHSTGLLQLGSVP